MRLSLVLLLVVVSCTKEDAAAPSPSAPAADDDAHARDVARATTPSSEPFFVVGTSTAWCVQFRSVNDVAVASQIAADLEHAHGLSLHRFVADLGDKGTWTRLCAGAFPDEATARAAADAWTGEGGLLRPFMEPVREGQAAYLLKERPSVGKDALPPAVSRALESVPGAPRRARLVDSSPSLLFVVDSEDGARLVSTILDDQGHPLSLSSTTTGLTCAPCVAALAREPVTSSFVLAHGALTRDPGDELVVEERLVSGAALVSVLARQDASLVRRASLWLGPDQRERPRTLSAALVDLDGGPVRELALVREDLVVQGDALCSIARKVDVYALDDGALHREDPSVHDPARPLPRTKLLAVYDAHGDVRAASVACGRAAARGETGALETCQARVLALASQGRLVEAVNAAGLLAEASAKVRPIVALALVDAARSLDAAAEKSVVPEDCAKAPLVGDFVSRTRGAPLLGITSRADDDGAHPALADARAKARARVDLGELHDAVFVTARRDFGRETPFGALCEGWLTDIRAVLPARADAIEALLVAPKPRAEDSPPKR